MKRWPKTPCAGRIGYAAAVILLLLSSQAAAQDVAGAALPAGVSAAPKSVEDLRNLSSDQLAQLQVTSVSKSPVALGEAPAAIYVITHDDVIRSGAMSIPEILRLAPNLQVAQTSASNYVITARGFGGNPADQSFSNKLLVLIDGRSVYTPLFSGVYWDMQEVLPENIERIEVISGPGATLWGANAVNGVINIITRKSSETQGGFVDVGMGNLGYSASLQYGGRLSDNLTYRAYVTTFVDDNTDLGPGAKAHDNWTRPQGGARFDWTPTASDVVTLQGDDYRGSHANTGGPNENISGDNVLGRWTHAWQDGSALELQAYYDHTARLTEDGGGDLALDTYDFYAQHSFNLGARNQFVWGGGYRIEAYNIHGTATLLFSPSRRTLDLSNLFAQDTFSVSPTASLILGLKLEDDPYSGVAALPSVRLTWKPDENLFAWAAVSRAIRSPTPFDRDVIEKAGTTVALVGGPDFRPETLTAYEVGARLRASSRLSFSASAFYNVYDDLRSIEIGTTAAQPAFWGNMIQGSTYGVEAWGEFQIAPWWRMTATYDYLQESLTFKPGASAAALGVQQNADDPRHQASLRSSMTFSDRYTLDADLRYVGVLPDPRVPAYVELNTRLGWNLSERVQLSLSGFNLLHDRHVEYPGGNAIPRSFFAELRWRF